MALKTLPNAPLPASLINLYLLTNPFVDEGAGDATLLTATCDYAAF